MQRPCVTVQQWYVLMVLYSNTFYVHFAVSSFQQQKIYDKRTKGERLQGAISLHGKRTLHNVLSSSSDDESADDSDDEIEPRRHAVMDSDEDNSRAEKRSHPVLKRRRAMIDSDENDSQPEKRSRPVLGQSGRCDIHDSDTSSEDEGGTPLEKDDVVALVESDSTAKQPKILLGKVLRIKSETAVLAWLQPTSTNKYRMCIGDKTWIESVNSLVHPIDVIYCHKTNMYTLRTPPIDIHNYVFEQLP